MGGFFIDRSPVRKWKPIIQFHLGIEHLVRICTEERFWRTAYLHWCSDLGKTVGCPNDSRCPYCPKHRREVTYVPASDWSKWTNRWQDSILGVTDKMRDQGVLERPSATWRGIRLGRNNSPVRMQIAQEPELASFAKIQGYDVEESLLKCWGAQLPVAARKAIA